jgi:hypothetical protein
MMHTPKAARMLSVRRVGPDMLVVRITLKYSHSTEVKTYSVLEEPQRRLGKVRFTFARHGGGKLYHTSYEPAKDEARCDCDAGKRKGWCCHGDSLRVLFHRGDLVGHDPSF